MLLVQLCFLSFILFADVAESKVYLVRDYEDEPIYIHKENKDKDIISKSPHIPKHKILGNTRHLKSKRGKHARQAVIHYGRHIYHLDNFDDLTKLRSPKSPDYISYDYFDIKDLIRTKAAQRDIPWDYIDDILYLADKPKRKKCKGKQCEENLRKYNSLFNNHNSKYKATVDKYVKRMKIPLGTLTRFKIIDNSKPRKPPPQRYESSEERLHAKRRPKPEYKKKKRYVPPSSSSEEDEGWDSDSKSSDSSEEEHKNYDSSSNSDEGTIYKKKKYSSESNSRSWEDSSVVDSNSNSIERSFQKMKQKIKGYSEKRKISSNEEVYLQGNKLIKPGGGSYDEDKRRRLPQFLPKRYHWDPEDMHDLGYYWFNGPKGKYPEPKALKF